VALDEFTLESSEKLRRSASGLVVGFGDLRGIDSGSIKRVNKLVAKRSAAEEIRRALETAIRIAAKSPKSEGRIGTELFSTVMTPERTITVMLQKQVATGGLKFEAPPTAVQGGAIVKLTITTPPFTSGTGLDEPCGCGSNKKTRDCHPPR
jgi:hypothetical protein